MGKPLIIVESPTKIKTLKKFLGDRFAFESSLGHVRDLPSKSFGIDVEEDFEPTYEMLPDKEKVVKQLIAAAKKADVVYLSPDPDREGEAIAWHIAALLPPSTVIKRAAFYSITKKEVERALSETQEINLALVDAQQARRLLDRMVGYKLSPILARRVQGGRRRNGGLSAGRVQSVALKMVVDREKEIESFIPIEYWVLQSHLLKSSEKEDLFATLLSVEGQRIEKEASKKNTITIGNEEEAMQLKKRLEKSRYLVDRVEAKEKQRHPRPPFITSSLQQEASRHLGYSTSKTMQVAQSLYEGIDMGEEGTEGLITYMRTDSVRIAPDAIEAVRELIGSQYGKEYLPEKVRAYRSKKSAQEAHEGIRPTNLDHPPEKVKSYLTRDQLRLYTLIWNRFVASQMASALYDTVTADIKTDCNCLLRATGSVQKFAGYLILYQDKDGDESEEKEQTLPRLVEGEPLDLLEVSAEQSFTRPPPRYSEASLVRALEQSGIGRPSTYAAIMAKIQSRSYTIRENNRLIPTELGRVCSDLLETYFPKIMDLDFTARMEDELEQVAANEKGWKSLLKEFWDEFLPTVEEAEEKAHVPKIDTDLPCPQCKKHHLQKIWARSKYFYGCSNYPDCDYSAPLEALHFDKSEYDPDFNWDQSCPICQSPMTVRHGRFGAFLGCSHYPKCKGTISIPKKGEISVPAEDLPPCPAIDCPGHLVQKRSRFGKIFFSCSTYPDCDVIVNQLDELGKKYAHHPRTPYQRKGKGRGGGRGKKKLSPELAAVCNAKELTRGEVTKALWKYIKEHNLQDPEDKRTIIPDEKLRAVFGSSEPVNMFHLAKIISSHLG